MGESVLKNRLLCHDYPTEQHLTDVSQDLHKRGCRKANSG